MTPAEQYYTVSEEPWYCRCGHELELHWEPTGPTVCEGWHTQSNQSGEADTECDCTHFIRTPPEAPDYDDLEDW